MIIACVHLLDDDWIMLGKSTDIYFLSPIDIYIYRSPDTRYIVHVSSADAQPYQYAIGGGGGGYAL